MELSPNKFHIGFLSYLPGVLFLASKLILPTLEHRHYLLRTMYCYPPFHLKDVFLTQGKLYHYLLRRMVYLLALTFVFCSFQVNAQSLSLSPYILAHERKAVVAPLARVIVGDYITSHKIIGKVIGICSMILLFMILFLTYRIKGKVNPYLITKYVSSILRKPKEDGDILLPEVPHTIEISSAPAKTLHAISAETYNSILKRISKFEKSEKFLRKDINLTWLSNHLNTNTKYLSEVIKSHTGKNFNGYINGLRIRYIINKLTEMPVYRDYKISYLAEECGYGSPQVFAIAFKRETGVTPSYFIEQFKNGPDDTLNQSSA